MALSTVEVEHVALVDSSADAFFMRHVWSCMLPYSGKPCMKVFENNQGAAALESNPVPPIELETHRYASSLLEGTCYQERILCCPHGSRFSSTIMPTF